MRNEQRKCEKGARCNKLKGAGSKVGNYKRSMDSLTEAQYKFRINVQPIKCGLKDEHIYFSSHF